MGRVTKACLHVSVEELQMRLKDTKDRRTAQKLLVILNAMVDPRPAAGDSPSHGGLGSQCT